jgi:hypothetical protein
VKQVDGIILKKIFNLSKELGKVSFQQIVYESTGFNIVPINTNDTNDKILVDILQNIIKSFLKTSKSARSRYHGDRVNEVGRRIEEVLVHEMNKQPLTVTKLVKPGYPDIQILQENNRVTYLELKTSSINEKSGFRYFYYTSGNKIKSNARHLLLNISVTEESPKYWKIDNWVLSDLSKLEVKLKCEFNASKTDIIDEKSKIISS